MTIRKRLALWYCALLTLLIIGFGIAVITVSRLTLLQTVDHVLADVVYKLAGIIDTVPIDTAYSLQIVYHDETVFHSPGISIQVWRSHENGQALPSPILERHANITGNTPLDASLINVHDISFNSTVINGVPERVVALPFYTKEGLPLGVIQIATPLHAIANANDLILLITAISALIVIAVSMALAMWLSGHLLKPIEAVKEAAASISKAEDLSTRLEWSGAKDELGDLSDVFNHMMERLEHLFGVQQRFIADVSHELRTPLTSIIGNLELMERYGMDAESLDSAQREASRMSRLVNDLLFLSRTDLGEVKVEFYPLDLDNLVLEVYEQVMSIATKRQLSMSIERHEAMQIVGNADRLRQLLLNLLSNAVKFSKDGGKIGISLYRDGEMAVIEVKDTGIGISDADKKRIFDRFFQADAARFHQDENDGSGLGLSIARWIVNVHGGKIDVHSTLGEGSLFRVYLPIKGKSKEAERITEPAKKHISIKKKAQK